jgi:hypothetical protein
MRQERQNPRIVDSFHAITPDSEDVITVAHWSGFSHDRHAFVIARNDRITSRRMASPTMVHHDIEAARTTLASSVVDGSRARQHLRQILGHRPRRCPDCEAPQPIGAPWCPSCSRPMGARPDGVLDGAITATTSA